MARTKSQIPSTKETLNTSNEKYKKFTLRFPSCTQLYQNTVDNNQVDSITKGNINILGWNSDITLQYGNKSLANTI